MSRRAHNSKFPDPLSFEGKNYSGPSELYHSASGQKVRLGTFTDRLRKRFTDGDLDDETIREALYLNPSEYRRLYGVRKTWVEVDGKKIDLESFHKAESLRASTSYRTFWQRLKKRKNIDHELLDHALTLSSSDWISFYGGGRHRNFVYEGDLHPEHYGEEFHSISAFLKKIDRYSDKSTIWSRMKAGWKLDDALSIPTDFATVRQGRIYQITREKTGQVYVGLTHSSVEQRWAFHQSAALRGASTKLAIAIRSNGPEGFNLEILEDNIDNPEELKKREVYWVERKGALGPLGLNSAQPGGIGSSRGVSFEWEGEHFESIVEAARVLGRRLALAPHVVERRIREGKPLRGQARRNSKHSDAGTNLFRRWLALKKRHSLEIDACWLDYDTFKADVEPGSKSESRLMRLDRAKPWGPTNWRLGSAQEAVEAVHGTKVVVKGKTYPSLHAVARHFDIGYSTLKNRIQSQGLTLDQAVEKPIGKTSFRKSNGGHVVEGQSFRSKRQALLYIAEKYGITEGQAKYRFEQGRFSSE